MTDHANLTIEEYEAALSVFDILCTDEDGNAELMTVVVTANNSGDGFDVLVYQGGDVVDSTTVPTIVEAGLRASDFMDEIRRDDRAMARTRIRNARVNAREALMSAAEEMTGEDADAAKLLALLIGAGRGPAALAALRRIATK